MAAMFCGVCVDTAPGATITIICAFSVAILFTVFMIAMYFRDKKQASTMVRLSGAGCSCGRWCSHHMQTADHTYRTWCAACGMQTDNTEWLLARVRDHVPPSDTLLWTDVATSSTKAVKKGPYIALTLIMDVLLLVPSIVWLGIGLPYTVVSIPPSPRCWRSLGGRLVFAALGAHTRHVYFDHCRRITGRLGSTIQFASWAGSACWASRSPSSPRAPTPVPPPSAARTR